jgi:hypothetical protein
MEIIAMTFDCSVTDLPMLQAARNRSGLISRHSTGLTNAFRAAHKQAFQG